MMAVYEGCWQAIHSYGIEEAEMCQISLSPTYAAELEEARQIEEIAARNTKTAELLKFQTQIGKGQAAGKVFSYQGSSLDLRFLKRMRTCYILVHLFSGRRRTGDLQMYLEHLNSGKDYDIMVLSVDLAVDRTKCDLMNPKQRQRWDDLLGSGRVAAVVMGPPCETFSAARENAIDGCSIRPIRTFAEPWGKRGCKNHEIEQLHTGNTLI